MISKHEKFRFTDANNRHTFFAEVNWNANDKKTNECKVVKVTHPNGDESFISTKELNAFLFAIGKPEDQRKMIPQQLQRVKVIETTLGITATKDIRKGEKINVPVKLDVPLSQEEVIGAVKK